MLLLTQTKVRSRSRFLTEGQSGWASIYQYYVGMVRDVKAKGVQFLYAVTESKGYLCHRQLLSRCTMYGGLVPRVLVAFRLWTYSSSSPIDNNV
jgi:hypothetical protein